MCGIILFGPWSALTEPSLRNEEFRGLVKEDIERVMDRKVIERVGKALKIEGYITSKTYTAPQETSPLLPRGSTSPAT
ncbi:hypothetical protein [Ignicoccus hospitalis]|uniref:Uncharacterized protein n=1 Tax=Ignicoccus hospitalis (strain KIN4/I / DSM 18386 / JCM 14125) TaxID=453591 RepID=A8ABA2_IGNH4|nr:hypothetical protein [Ignicoccus hospitalis]ABU82204.1 hypothetical protein Igni_1025 [Ignicoccus hospitalis KIN4/I]HIH91162.1 hypothetical protein [Desulfurococcaceae archaeon]